MVQGGISINGVTPLTVTNDVGDTITAMVYIQILDDVIIPYCR